MSLTALPPVDQVTDLVARARERGTVAMADLTAAFDRCDLPAEAVEGVLRLLADEGVEIIEAPPEDPEDLRREVQADGARRAVTGDLVRIYLREIGRVPLLTAQDEVDLAKAIEAGLFAEEKLQDDGAPAAEAGPVMPAPARARTDVSRQVQPRSGLIVLNIVVLLIG